MAHRFIDGLPIKNGEFAMAMLNNQMVKQIMIDKQHITLKLLG